MDNDSAVAGDRDEAAGIIYYIVIVYGALSSIARMALRYIYSLYPAISASRWLKVVLSGIFFPQIRSGGSSTDNSFFCLSSSHAALFIKLK